MTHDLVWLVCKNLNYLDDGRYPKTFGVSFSDKLRNVTEFRSVVLEVFFKKELYFQTTFPKKWLNKTLQITRRRYGAHAVNIHVYRKRYPNTLTTFYLHIFSSLVDTHHPSPCAHVFAPKNGRITAFFSERSYVVSIYTRRILRLPFGGGTYIKPGMAWWRFFILCTWRTGWYFCLIDNTRIRCVTELVLVFWPLRLSKVVLRFVRFSQAPVVSTSFFNSIFQRVSVNCI